MILSSYLYTPFRDEILTAILSYLVLGCIIIIIIITSTSDLQPSTAIANTHLANQF